MRLCREEGRTMHNHNMLEVNNLSKNFAGTGRETEFTAVDGISFTLDAGECLGLIGESGCGKSTMAKDLARSIGYIYIDSGAMYRAVTLYAIENGMFAGDVLDEQKLKDKIGNVTVSFKMDENKHVPVTCLNGTEVEDKIRGMEVSSKVSYIAALDFVRNFLTAQQQEMGKEKGIVMDGRDIGTTVFPDAELKIFVTASPEIRAKRRFDELKAKGVEDVNLEDILKNVEERDRIDQNRKVSPLKQAEDALVLDNSNMTIEEQKAWLLERFKERTEC